MDMPVNAGPEYFAAERKYFEAQTTQERIAATEEMIRAAPKHKSSENLLALLRTRLKKLREHQEKAKKTGKSSRKTIKKEGYQCVLIGLPNAGKSSLLASLTNAQPHISPVPFTTQIPEIGTLDFHGIKAQIVDLPAITAESFDSGITNTADCLLLVVEKLEDLPLLDPVLTRTSGALLIVITKSDLLTQEQHRKLEMTVSSKRLNALLVSVLTPSSIDALKEKIIQSMHVVRVYTKEPGKSNTHIPVVRPVGSSVRDVAESILKGFSARVKETRLTGPSSKFPNQRVGLTHLLKDKDIVEFHTN